jgi:hypothetical protein
MDKDEATFSVSNSTEAKAALASKSEVVPVLN